MFLFKANILTLASIIKQKKLILLTGPLPKVNRHVIFLIEKEDFSYIFMADCVATDYFLH